jgi:multicomponent Na+:H+ antiporter subunit F
MNEWQVAAAVLVACLVPCGWVCARASYASGLVALQLAGTLGSLALLLLSEGELRQSFADLALALAFASFVGTLVLARFIGNGEGPDA